MEQVWDVSGWIDEDAAPQGRLAKSVFDEPPNASKTASPGCSQIAPSSGLGR